MNSGETNRVWSPAGWREATPGDAVQRPWLLPGIANIHSHAFQRAMSGLTERRGPSEDSFWSWRERMYALAARFDPSSLRAVAAQVYMEMLEAGYTSVCEFQYLHHAADGCTYADPAEMSLALIAAAEETGIGLLLLPTLYQTGGFDRRPLAERQRRFQHSVDGYLRLLDRLEPFRRAQLDIGVCFHSLRAVPEDSIRAVLEATSRASQPVHLHVSEQMAEVEECLALRGARPVAWLLDNFPVDSRWCLVHATHLDPDEATRLAASQACVALCPTTEANLGDGLFPLAAFLDAEGRVGVGSDSHASVSLCEELRWLEYGQRLLTQRRNISARRAGLSTGAALFAAVSGGGQQASGGSLDSGWFSLDASAVELAERDADCIVDSWLFGSSRPLINEVWVNGVQQVNHGRHRLRDEIEQRFRTALRYLLANG